MLLYPACHDIGIFTQRKCNYIWITFGYVASLSLIKENQQQCFNVWNELYFFCNLKKWNNNLKKPALIWIKIDAIINCVNRESNFRRNINDQFGLRLNTKMRNILHLVLLDLLLGSIILFIMLESIWNVNKKGS